MNNKRGKNVLLCSLGLVFMYEYAVYAYFEHIWGRGNLERSNMIQTPGGRADLSQSTDRPGYSSAQRFQADKLIKRKGSL